MRQFWNCGPGILIWGAACQLIPIWFIKDKGGYSLGLWIGVILASAAAFHMWWSLDRGLDREGRRPGLYQKACLHQVMP